MSDWEDETRELRMLLILSANDEATLEQQQRLSDLLEQPALSSDAVRLLDQLSSLEDASRFGRPVADAAPLVEVLPKRESPTQGWANRFDRRIVIATSLLLSHAVAIGATWFYVHRTWMPAPVRVVSSQDFAPAPQLISMTACVWENAGAAAPFVGQTLQKGEVLTLLEGIAEVEFGDSEGGETRVRIEGPASVFVRSDGQMGLRHGVMTADLNDRREPFTFDTPLGRIEVPGQASLGLVATGDRNEVHTFSGKVILTSQLGASEAPLAELHDGEAARLLIGTRNHIKVEHMDASRELFASAHSMNFDRLSVGQAYRDAVMSSGPAVYWRFDKEDREVVNEVPGHVLNTVLEGSVNWPQFAENRAAEFGVTASAGTFVSNGQWPTKPLSEYAVELWIKPSHYHNGSLISLVGGRQKDGRYPHGLMIELGGPTDLAASTTPPNGLRFLHRNPLSTHHMAGSACKCDTFYAVRQWQYVVARKQGTQMELYVDSKLVSSCEDKTDLPAGLTVVLGQLYPLTGIQTYSQGFVRPFVGQLDEVALYERALSPTEISEHFEVGRKGTSLTQRQNEI